MGVLRSGTIYVKSEPQDTATNSRTLSKETPTNSQTLSPAKVSANKGTTPSQRVNDPVKQEPESVSTLTPPTTPLLPSPEATYTCNCGKLAKQYFCRNGRPENINKYYYKCAEEKCRYWKWIESEEDAHTRLYGGKRKRDDEDVGGRNCYCGRPALRLVSKNGMPHNDGRAFYKCATGKCGLWIWADGTLPFSNTSQARFNEYMDGYLGFDDEDEYDDDDECW